MVVAHNQGGCLARRDPRTRARTHAHARTHARTHAHADVFSHGRQNLHAGESEQNKSTIIREALAGAEGEEGPQNTTRGATKAQKRPK